MSEYLVFDWGGTDLKYAIMNDLSEILEQGKVPSPSREASQEEFLETIDQIVLPVKERVEGIAISSPGIIDSKNGIIRLVSVFPYLNGCCIPELFKERYGFPCAIENDGKSAALAELWKGNLQGIDDGAVLLIGTGVGGGLIFDGKLRRGKDFMCGEFSLVCTNLSKKEEKESYWAELGYKGLFRRLEKVNGEDVTDLNGYQFFERAQQGDTDVLKALEMYTDDLAMTLFSLNNLLNLERICIGGGISAAPLLMEYLRKSIQKIPEYNPDMLAGLDLPLPDVCPCRFSNDANLIGALYHFLYEQN